MSEESKDKPPAPEDQDADLVDDLGLVSDEELDQAAGGLRIGIRRHGAPGLRKNTRADLREQRIGLRVPRKLPKKPLG